MNLRVTARALADAKRMKTWWQRHRPDAKDLFEHELDIALDSIVAAPKSGRVYRGTNLNVEVRRMPKTRNDVYYAVTLDDGVVLTVWGAAKRGGPNV